MTAELVRRHRWITFVLPFCVYMLAGSFEPTPDKPGGGILGLAIPYSAYPILYTVKLGLTLAAMAFVAGGYRDREGGGEKAEGGRRKAEGGNGTANHLLALLVGVVGVVLWIGLWKLGLERKLLDYLGLSRFLNLGERPAFNPFAHFAASPAMTWSFLAVRFLGLAVIVPVIEEFFLRGFLMRMVMAADWWDVPFGKVDKLALAMCLLYAGLTHPAELLAALVWFGLVTWLAVRTKNLWDCVLAHAVTNLLLGLYVVHYGVWTLW